MRPACLGVFPMALALIAVTGCGGKIAPTEQSSSGGSGPVLDDGRLPRTPSGSSSSSSGSSLGCQLTGSSFEADFEDGSGIPSELTVNSPSAFSTEWSNPISGSVSLRVEPNLSSYLSRKTPSLCAVRLKFRLGATAEFVDGASHLARIDGGALRITLESNGGVLTVREEAGAATRRTDIGAFYPYDPTSIMLDLDTRQKKITFGISSSAGPAVGGTYDVMVGVAGQPAIVAVDLGSTPGQSTPQPSGVYWLDDIEIN